MHIVRGPPLVTFGGAPLHYGNSSVLTTKHLLPFWLKPGCALSPIFPALPLQCGTRHRREVDPVLSGFPLPLHPWYPRVLWEGVEPHRAT